MAGATEAFVRLRGKIPSTPNSEILLISMAFSLSASQLSTLLGVI